MINTCNLAVVSKDNTVWSIKYAKNQKVFLLKYRKNEVLKSNLNTNQMNLMTKIGELIHGVILLGILKLQGTSMNKQLPIIHQKIKNHFGLLLDHNNELYTHVFSTDQAKAGHKSFFIDSKSITEPIKDQYLWSPAYKIGKDLFKFKYEPLATKYFQLHEKKIINILDQVHNWDKTDLDAKKLTIFITEKFT